MQTSLEINANSEVQCPDCGEMIRVGDAAIENLNKWHWGEKACDENEQKKDVNVNNWMWGLWCRKNPSKEERDSVEIESSSEWVSLCHGCLRCGHPYPVCHVSHDCIWYVMSISGMLVPYLVCYSHHVWSVQPSVALKKNWPDILKKKSEPPLILTTFMRPS
jgi:hypothetical protein